MSASAPKPPLLAVPARVTPSVVGRRTILAVSGEIDLDSVSVLGAALDEAVTKGALEVWVDLSGTEFMDSSGVHVLLAARGHLDALNRRLAVICPRGGIRRLLELSGAAAQLALYEDRAAANRAG